MALSTEAAATACKAARGEAAEAATEAAMTSSAPREFRPQHEQAPLAHKEAAAALASYGGGRAVVVLALSPTAVVAVGRVWCVADEAAAAAQQAVKRFEACMRADCASKLCAVVLSDAADGGGRGGADGGIPADCCGISSGVS